MMTADAVTVEGTQPESPPEPAQAAAQDAAGQAFASGADWAETAWDEDTEMEFVDEIRARQIEQLVRSGRMPVPAPPHGNGFQSARALSREREGRSGGGRPTSRGFHASLAASMPPPAAAAAAAAAVAAASSAAGGTGTAVDAGMMPRPPPKRAGSPPHAGRRPAPPPKAAGATGNGRVMSGRTVRGGRTVAAAAPAAPVCV